MNKILCKGFVFLSKLGWTFSSFMEFFLDVVLVPTAFWWTFLSGVFNLSSFNCVWAVSLNKFLLFLGVFGDKSSHLRFLGVCLGFACNRSIIHIKKLFLNFFRYFLNKLWKIEVKKLNFLWQIKQLLLEKLVNYQYKV